MKISKVTINNFRSIENAVFDLNDFNVFVGQNNAGKTNLLKQNGSSKGYQKANP